MPQAPEWTQEEFETLLRNPNASAAELTKQLPRRSAGAIEVVRAGIHAFHTGGDTSMLSKVMMARLEGGMQGLICAVCRASLE